MFAAMRLCAWLVAALLCAPVLAAGVLNVGLVPAEDPNVVIADNKPFMDALGQALQMEVKPFVATDYNGVIEALRAKKLDIALLGPFSYVLAASVAEVDAFAVVETPKQTTSYRALIIARKERGLQKLTDLKGRTFAFVDPSSTSGHLFPKAAMIKAGIDPEKDLGRVIFSGGHDATALAVQNGKVDAGAIADGLFEAALARGVVKREELAVVWTSEAIPGSPFCMRRDLPAELRKRIRDAFYAMRDVPWGSKGTMKRWDPIDDRAYDGVREAAKVLNLDLRKLK
jgi:phosphonate transport system substrate-binding protein